MRSNPQKNPLRVYSVDKKNTHEPHGAVHGFCERECHPMVKPRAESTAVMVVKAMLMMTLHLFLES